MGSLAATVMNSNSQNPFIETGSTLTRGAPTMMYTGFTGVDTTTVVGIYQESAAPPDSVLIQHTRAC